MKVISRKSPIAPLLRREVPGISLFLGLMACLCLAAQAAPWRPAPGPLMTRWSADVQSTNAHPEYPRPQMVRSNWLNLNGLWDYAISPTSPDVVPRYEGSILVPFPIESALSGVMRAFGDGKTLWYRRHFSIPAAWRQSRIMLRFGAVDWQARVFINGNELATHRGGYDPFSVDITKSLRNDGTDEVVVAVEDPTDGEQARGKQTHKPDGIFYTATSGIWQTVWIEPLPSEASIDTLKAAPDLDGRCMRLKVGVNSIRDPMQIEAVAYAGGTEVGRIAGPANQELKLPLNQLHPWSPDDPFLYDLKITLLDNGDAVDSVTSYFGMRKIALRKDDEGIVRIALNDKLIFQSGVLDQGFWPDGIYTAPTDDASKSDIEFLKSAGFNMIRKHVKVEPDRWYYWCDKLGMLVWQDMPTGNHSTDESRAQFEAELQQMVKNLHNHPSVVLWVLFNEGWGQYDTERLTSWLRALDPSRLIDSASGWTDKHVGDVIDIHSYPSPDAPPAETGRAAVLGEFGGFGWVVTNHTWSDRFWAYKVITEAEMRGLRYSFLYNHVWKLRDSSGLSAAVYTQATDVETECNGLLTYDRAIAKFDPVEIRSFNNGQRRVPVQQVIAPNAVHEAVYWKYTMDEPTPGWNTPGFDASEWKEGVGGFGSPGTPGAIVHTVWQTPDIWLRREFSVDEKDLTNLKLQFYYDEDAQVYINGVLATQTKGFSADYVEVDPSPASIATLHSGRNVMAVHCHQTTGGQFIDVGLVIGLPKRK